MYYSFIWGNIILITLAAFVAFTLINCPPGVLANGDPVFSSTDVLEVNDDAVTAMAITFGCIVLLFILWLIAELSIK